MDQRKTMQALMNSLDSRETLDYDNLNIVTHPPPPRRRQSGVSLIPYRPYVKCLTSVRQSFSYANGTDKWMVSGSDETFFTQPNARCIGSLLSDCHISDIIRWDIEGESTRLPMMCKLWMIVDGAVVERGKPHMVQDAAVQVFTAGRHRRMLLAAQQRYDQSLLAVPTTRAIARHRRQSWHDLNEYYSVPYYQYTRPVRAEFQEGTQCDLDNQYYIGKQETLPNVDEHAASISKIDEYTRDTARGTVHYSTDPQERAQISITTQTEAPFAEQATAIDLEFARMYNLNLETNEILLSPIVNPYYRAVPSDDFAQVITVHRHGKEYQHRPISTGEDYPHWWLRLTTDLVLADFVTNQGEEKEKSLPPPSPRHDQSIQTDVDKSRPSSSRSSRVQKSSSPATTLNHYELIDETDDGQRGPRRDSRFSDDQNEHASVRYNGNHMKHSEADYTLFVSSLNQQQQQSSTPDNQSSRTERHYSSTNTTPRPGKGSQSASTSVLAGLLERYERSMLERQHAFTIINDQLLDVDDVLRHYRDKIQNLERANTTMEHHRDASLLSARSLSSMTNVIRDKYRVMAEITPDEMIQGYVPAPRRYLASSTLTSPRERQAHFRMPPREVIRPDYYNLCLTDYNSSSAWVRYNERRVEQLQRRIDLMLQIDDNEEEELLRASTYPPTATVSQRIDDMLLRRTRHRSPLLDRHDRTLSTHQSPYRLPYRLNQSLPATPRQLSRNGTRPTTPVSKSVRISTRSVPVTPRARQSPPTSRPIVSILRRSSIPSSPRSPQPAQLTHVWRSQVDGKVHSLKPFSIPRYYRLYNDASFREMYNFSRVLDSCLTPDRTREYSSLLTTFVLDQPLHSPITSAA